MVDLSPEHRSPKTQYDLLIKHVEGDLRILPGLAARRKLRPEVTRALHAHLKEELDDLTKLRLEDPMLTPEERLCLRQDLEDRGAVRNFIAQGLTRELAEEELAKRYKGIVTKFRLQQEGVIK